jgi:putative hydrolases of HD superfamily
MDPCLVMDTARLLAFMHLLERLKSTTRHSWTSDGRQESVAEHSWRLATMALLLKPRHPELNFDKVLAMALLHDLGEAVNGDIPHFHKTEDDVKDEEAEIRRILDENDAVLSGEIAEALTEYLEGTSLEARFLDAIDKLEAVVQHNEAPFDTWTPREHELNLTHGENEARGFSLLRELRDAVRAETIKKIAGKR